jgi:hypothetical protein
VRAAAVAAVVVLAELDRVAARSAADDVVPAERPDRVVALTAVDDVDAWGATSTSGPSVPLMTVANGLAFAARKQRASPMGNGIVSGSTSMADAAGTAEAETAASMPMQIRVLLRKVTPWLVRWPGLGRSRFAADDRRRAPGISPAPGGGGKRSGKPPRRE